MLPVRLSLLLCALCSASLTAQSPAAQQDSGAPRVLPAAGAPEGSLSTPVVRTQFSLADLGLVVVDERVVQPDGSVARRTMLPDGSAVDLEALRREDHALGLERRGRMTPALLERVQALAPGERLEVAFWLSEPLDDPAGGAGLRGRTAAHAEAASGEPLATAVRAERATAHAQALQRYESGNSSFAARITATGGDVVLVGDVWPFVIARVTAEQARALALDISVDEAYLSQPTWFEEGDFAQGTLRTPHVWAQGILAGSQVNILVNDTAQVQTTNQYLPPIVTLNSASAGSHATGVAGNIANTHPTYKAANYTINQLYSAGGTGDSTAPTIWSDAIITGIDYGNCSWWNGLKGSIAFLDRFFDHTIRNFGVMLFKSTGNQGNTSTPYSTTPGNGYNMISTGAYSDLDDVTWSGDVMAGSSSYWDPIEGHEKPEVASPGTGVATTSTGASGLTTSFGGTSSASPLTCGVAGLITAGDTTLLTQMTTLKAVLMASAWHNVEGDPLLSEFDGAGGIHAAAAWALVRDQQWWNDEVVDADFAGGILDVPMDVLAGEDVRVVALWFSNPDAAYSTDVLDMDVDLTVLDPGSNVVASSASALNPFEIAAFQATVSGTYTVRLTRQRFDGISEPLSVAWSTRPDSATASVALAPGSAPFAVGMSPTMLFGEGYEGAGKSYVAWAALGAPTGFAFGTSGYTLPTSYDFFARATVMLPGFSGTLDASGQATAQLPIPNLVQAIGVPLHFGLVVLGPTSTLDDVYTVAADTVFTIAP